MKNTSKYVATLVAIAMAPFAFADETETETEENGGGRSFGDGGLPEFLVPFDLDENGVLSEEERQAAREARKEIREKRRDRIDTDGDGEISDEEKEAARDAARAMVEKKRNERFVAADTDEDGFISGEEFAAIPAIAKLIENHGDRGIARARAIFDRLDSNDDGQISLEEFLKHLKNHRDRRDPRNDRPTRPTRDGGEVVAPE